MTTIFRKAILAQAAGAAILALTLGAPTAAAHGDVTPQAVDVSTLKELARRWHPEVAKGVKKQGKHEALADIQESIDELRHYRDTFLRLPDPQ